MSAGVEETDATAQASSIFRLSRLSATAARAGHRLRYFQAIVGGCPSRSVGANRVIADIRQDLQYGLRSLIKSPGFTVMAVLTLALGVGANAAIFSVLRAVVLRDLPYHDADRIAVMWTKNIRQNLPDDARPRFEPPSPVRPLALPPALVLEEGREGNRHCPVDKGIAARKELHVEGGARHREALHRPRVLAQHLVARTRHVTRESRSRPFPGDTHDGCARGVEDLPVGAGRLQGADRRAARQIDHEIGAGA